MKFVWFVSVCAVFAVLTVLPEALAESAAAEESNPFLEAANALLQESLRGKSGEWGGEGDNGLGGMASGMFGLVQSLMASQGGGKR